MKCRLIIQAKYIPDGATVTTVTGTKEYKLIDQIPLYSKEGKSVIRKQGSKILSDSRHLNLIDNEAELCWIASIAEVKEVLERLTEREEDK